MRGRVLMPLAAAAAVTAVALTVTLAGGRTDQHPATQAPTSGAHTSSARGPSTTAPTPSTTSRTPVPGPACRTGLPAAWRAAVADGTTTAGAASAFPLFVTNDGRVLISRDFGTSRDVALLTPGGSAQRIYSVPAPDQNQVLDGVVEGNRALIVVSRLPRNSNGVLQTVDRIVVLDLRTGGQTVVASNGKHNFVTGGRTIDGATLYRGRVYYDVRKSYVSNKSAIHEYDVAAGTDRVIATAGGDGPGAGPALTRQGVVWSKQTMQLGVPRALPAPVADAAQGSRAASSLASDGTAYAWLSGRRELGYWAPSMSAPEYLRIPGLSGVDAVSGSFVIVDGAGKAPSLLLDARSHAVAPLAGVQPYALSAGSLVAAYDFAGSKEAFTVVALDTSHLPALRC